MVCVYLLLGGGGANAESVEIGQEQFYHWSNADFNKDGRVDLQDFAEFARNYKGPGSISTEDTIGTDTNAGGIVDVNDLTVLTNDWLRNAEEEFGPSYGKIVIGSRKFYEPNGDWKKSKNRIINKSDYPNLNNYQIDVVVAGVGTNQGITAILQILDWEFDYLSDPDAIIQFTTVPGNRIKAPGAGGSNEKTFDLIVNSQIGDDPNKIVYENKPIDASTSAGYQCNTVICPQPVNKN